MCAPKFCTRVSCLLPPSYATPHNCIFGAPHPRRPGAFVHLTSCYATDQVIFFLFRFFVCYCCYNGSSLCTRKTLCRADIFYKYARFSPVLMQFGFDCSALYYLLKLITHFPIFSCLMLIIDYFKALNK